MCSRTDIRLMSEAFAAASPVRQHDRAANVLCAVAVGIFFAALLWHFCAAEGLW